MDKKSKMIGGKFNPEEVEAIEKTLDVLGINQNRMVRAAVAQWMEIVPTIDIVNKMPKFSEIAGFTKGEIDISKKTIRNKLKGKSKSWIASALMETERGMTNLLTADKNYHTLKKKKKLGRRPSPKRKRGKPKR